MGNPPEYAWLLDNVSNYWSRWIHDTDAFKTLQYGGYYTSVVQPGPFPVSWTESAGLRIISINTLLYDSHNYLVSGDDPAGQWKWLENTLSSAAQNGQDLLVHSDQCRWISLDHWTYRFLLMFSCTRYLSWKWRGEWIIFSQIPGTCKQV